jgi:tetratricopeptide (TPR) repeat protein
LAPCYEALGKNDLAKAAFETALEKLPGSAEVARQVAGFYMRTGNLDGARSLLKQIVDRKVNASESDIAWAKSGLALAAVAGDSYSGLAEAAKLVGLRVDANGELVDDKNAAQDNTIEGLRARARLLATQTRRAPRTRAVEILEDLNRRQALSPDDQFLLAQLHAAQGQWQETRQLLANLAETRAGNAVYLSYFVQSLLAKGEIDEAQRLFTRLEAENPIPEGSVNLGRLVLKAELLEARQKGDEAVALLTANSQRQGAPPEELLLVVASLGRQKRIKEGLDVCEQAWKTCPAEQVGGVCVALLRAAPTDDGQAARVEQWLSAAIAKDPNMVALHLHFADLYDLRHDYREVEKQYRLVLASDQENILALNNLAWLLAMRTGKGDEALQLIERAIRKAGPRPELLDTRAVAKLALKQSEQAIADLERAAAEAPAGIQFFHMARAHELAKNPTASAAALKQAKQLGLKRQNLHPIEVVASGKLAEELDGP